MKPDAATIPGLVYTPHALIQKDRWDHCILQSAGGLIYSTSWYLDQMAAAWDALILDDYKAVMPLPWKKKYGIKYIYPPAFTQQLGISTVLPQNQQMLEAFIEAIPKKFQLVEMNLNASNIVPPHTGHPRKNYVLDISKPYMELRQNYSRSAVRNIQRAKESGVSIAENTDPEFIVRLHRERFADGIGTNPAEYAGFLELLGSAGTGILSYCPAAYNREGMLIAGSIFLLYKNRVYFVLNGNNKQSLENGATHLLMDHALEYFSNRGLVMDFEGSDNPSFARFYEQYGASPETYYFIRKNRLPFFIRWLKPVSDQHQH